MSLDRQIEAVLFYKAAPQKKTDLAKLFGVSASEIDDALVALKERLAGGVTKLVETEKEIELVLDPSFDELIESMRRDELRRDIGKAGAETLAIVLYRGPIGRSEIDRIRGVNSAYILRNLETRGLVERSSTGRQNEYRITPDLLKHLGIKEKTELPGYANVMNALENYEQQLEASE